MSDKIVIGMTGPFGSGCTYISKRILEPLGYKYLSLSDFLRNSITDGSTFTRTELQDKGNELRSTEGNEVLAKKAIDYINSSPDNKFIVDSIRNTHEVEEFKKTFPNFYLFAIWADKDRRWERIKDKYENNLSSFETDDKRDKDENLEYGQQITLCYQLADIIILNKTHIHSTDATSFSELKNTTKRYIEMIEKRSNFEPFSFVPSEQEALMTMAYANSMRSSCLKRKVGALIIDEFGNVFSSGFNEVPSSESPCKSEYGDCYRSYLRRDIDTKLAVAINDPVKASEVSSIIKKNSKMLDYCRALHAEENAIVNMARLSVSADFSKSTLYTTTYPCNLCANKIAQVGIKKIIYYEPYPQKEAKEILKAHNIEQIPFEGVTFNSYFKFMEVLR